MNIEIKKNPTITVTLSEAELVALCAATGHFDQARRAFVGNSEVVANIKRESANILADMNDALLRAAYKHGIDPEAVWDYNDEAGIKGGVKPTVDDYELPSTR